MHATYVVTAPLLPGSTQEPGASTWAQHNPAFAQVLERGPIRVFSVVGNVSPTPAPRHFGRGGLTVS